MENRQRQKFLILQSNIKPCEVVNFLVSNGEMNILWLLYIFFSDKWTWLACPWMPPSQILHCLGLISISTVSWKFYNLQKHQTTNQVRRCCYELTAFVFFSFNWESGIEKTKKAGEAFRTWAGSWQVWRDDFDKSKINSKLNRSNGFLIHVTKIPSSFAFLILWLLVVVW